MHQRPMLTQSKEAMIKIGMESLSEVRFWNMESEKQMVRKSIASNILVLLISMKIKCSQCGWRNSDDGHLRYLQKSV